MPDAATALAALRDLLGPQGCVTDAADMAPALREWRGRYTGRAPLIARPADTAQVAAVLRICNGAGIGVVPQGGNTGLCGGAVPDDSGTQIVLSLARMNRVIEVDPFANTLTAEAGCVLADAQRAAAGADRLLALSLAAEGSCQIGGNVATNAGGTNVLRYGTMREQVLGLQAVLPDGRVFDALRGLRKDTGGYDLKQLFIGSEGTLGVITAVCCRLHPMPAAVSTAIAAVDGPGAALRLLALLRERLGDSLGAFELMPRFGMELVLRHVPGCSDPLSRPYPWYVLMDCVRFAADDPDALAHALSAAAGHDLVADAAFAASEAQRASLWRLRENLSEAQKREAPGIKHDVSVPLARMETFIDRGTALVRQLLPQARVLAFGHVGDGNVHFNAMPPPGADPVPFLARWEEVNRQVHDLAMELGGSFSAEHGVGRLKAGELARLRSPVEVALMRDLKRLVDPVGIMNPGKVIGG